MTFDLGVAADSHRDRPRSVNTSTVAVAGSSHAAIPLQGLAFPLPLQVKVGDAFKNGSAQSIVRVAKISPCLVPLPRIPLGIFLPLAVVPSSEKPSIYSRSPAFSTSNYDHSSVLLTCFGWVKGNQEL